MKLLKWETLNPTARRLLNPDSDKWTVKAALRFFGFFVFVPFWIVFAIYAIATDTNWQQVGTVVDKLLWLLIGVLGWAFQKVRSMSGTDILLICILFMLVRIANLILALHESVTEWHDEWQSQNTEGAGDDFSD